MEDWDVELFVHTDSRGCSRHSAPPKMGQYSISQYLKKSSLEKRKQGKTSNITNFPVGKLQFGKLYWLTCCNKSVFPAGEGE